MRDACIKSVESAIGRPITTAEATRIEQRIARAQRYLAARDPEGWRAMSPSSRLQEAGREAAKQLIAEAQKAKQRVDLSVLAEARIQQYREEQVSKGRDKTGVDAIQRTLHGKYDLQNGGFVSVETLADSTFDNAARQIAEVFDVVSPGLWQRIQKGIWDTAPLRRAMVDALHGKTDGVPPEIVAAAKKYHEIADAMREHFNSVGGMIGRLEDWGLSHNWSARLAAKFGQETYVADMLRWTEPRRYVKEDGSFFTPEERAAFFEETYKTTASDGITKERETREFKGGAIKANRGAHHRVIHLKPEFAAEALAKYSEQNPLEAMLGGLRRMSRDIALVETYGPAADLAFQRQLNEAKTEAARLNPEKAQEYEAKARYLRNIYDHLAGNDPPPVNRALADFGRILRNVQVASKLGGAVISSISDFATLYQTAILNKLSPMKVMLNSALAWAPKSRRYVRRMGLMVDTILGEAQRYTGENVTTKDVSAQVANAVVRASGLNFVTNARRLGFAMTMMDAIGHLTRQYADVTKLREADFRILASKGITQETWNIWRQAKLDRWGSNHTLLTPDNIMAVEGPAFEAKRKAVTDLLGIVREEQDLAVITPGARERVQLTQGGEAGTWMGELVRSMVLFKSFPWTVTQRHIERGMAMEGRAGKFGYLVSLMIFMTMGGVLANWIKDMLNGKDPRNMNALSPDEEVRAIAIRNWIQAGLSGGGTGIYGEFLFSESSPYSQNTLAETMMGPNVSTVGSALNLTFGNMTQALEGEETNIGSEAVRFARSITPGANLWYTKALTDRAIFNQLQELTDPGALDKMQARQARVQGTSYYWNPQDPTPERAPDLSAGTDQPR